MNNKPFIRPLVAQRSRLLLGTPRSGAIFPNETEIILGHENGKISIWNQDNWLRDKRNRQAVMKKIDAFHVKAVTGFAFINNDWFVSISSDGDMILWRRNANEAHAFYPSDRYRLGIGKLRSVTYSPEHNMILVTGLRGFRLYAVTRRDDVIELKTNRELSVVKQTETHCHTGFFSRHHVYISFDEELCIYRLIGPSNKQLLERAYKTTPTRGRLLTHTRLYNHAVLTGGNRNTLDFWTTGLVPAVHQKIFDLGTGIHAITRTQTNLRLIVADMNGHIRILTLGKLHSTVESEITLFDEPFSRPPKILVPFGNDRYLLVRSGITDSQPAVLDFGSEQFGESTPPTTPLENLFTC